MSVLVLVLSWAILTMIAVMLLFDSPTDRNVVLSVIQGLVDSLIVMVALLFMLTFLNDNFAISGNSCCSKWHRVEVG